MAISRRKVLLAVVAVALVGGNVFAWRWVDQRAQRRHLAHEVALRQQAEDIAERQRQVEEQREVDKVVAALRDPSTRDATAMRLLGVVNNDGADSKSGQFAIRALVAALDDTNVEVRRTACSTLWTSGPAAHEIALPGLVKALSDSDDNVRSNAANSLGGGPGSVSAIPNWTRALTDSSADVRRSAAESLGRLGPPAASAAPTLVTLLSDQQDSVCSYSQRALEKIGAGAVPALVPALTHHNVVIRKAAARILGHYGAGAKEAVPALAKALDDSDEFVLTGASSSLARIGTDGMRPLLAAVSHKNPVVRKAVAGVLGGHLEAAGMGPALASALADSDVEVRRAAAASLAQHAGRGLDAFVKWTPEQIKAHEDLLPTILKAADDADANVRSSVAQALVLAGQKKESTVPALAKLLLTDRESFVRQSAAKTLGRVGHAAVPTLVKALAEPNSPASVDVLEALMKIGPAATEVVPALIQALRNSSDPFRVKVAEALGAFEPSDESVAALADTLAETDVTRGYVPLRRAAVKSLENFGWKWEWTPQFQRRVQVVPPPPSLTKAVPMLTKAVTDPDSHVRLTAMRVIALIGARAKEAVPALAKVVADPDFHHRIGAIRALEAIGPDAAIAVPDLVNALGFAESDVRKESAIALGMIGPRAKDAIPALEGLSKSDRDYPVRNAGITALEAIRKKE